MLVVAIGFMAMTLYKRPRKMQNLTQTEKEIQLIKEQSTSDEIDSIEEDLNETDFIDIDKELQDIETELDSVTY